MKIVISTRMSEESLAFLLTTLEGQGYQPRNLTEVMRFAAASLISRCNPSILQGPPPAEALSKIRAWKSGKTSQIDEHFTVGTTPTGVTTPDVVTPNSPFPYNSRALIDSLPTPEQAIAERIIAATNAGVPLIQQLQHEDSTVARITHHLCMQLPRDKFTTAEQATLTKLYKEEEE